jgi:hypothetical protein
MARRVWLGSLLQQGRHQCILSGCLSNRPAAEAGEDATWGALSTWVTFERMPGSQKAHEETLFFPKVFAYVMEAAWNSGIRTVIQFLHTLDGLLLDGLEEVCDSHITRSSHGCSATFPGVCNDRFREAPFPDSGWRRLLATHLDSRTRSCPPCF